MNAETERIKVQIVDSDERYLDALKRFLYQKKSNIIFSFGSVSEDEEVVIIQMTEDERDTDHIYKFLSGPEILEEIELRLQKAALQKSIEVPTVYGVTSPFGRSGKTDFSVGLSLLKSQVGRTALLSFDPFSTLKLDLCLEETDAFSSLIYALQTKEELEISDYLTKFEKLELILPTEMPEDLFETDGALFQKLICKLKSAGFPFIIVDFQRDLRLLKSVYNELDILYVTDMKEIHAEEKKRQFEAFLARCMTEHEVPLKYVQVPKRKVVSENKNYKDELLFGEIGQAIRETLL